MFSYFVLKVKRQLSAERELRNHLLQAVINSHISQSKLKTTQVKLSYRASSFFRPIKWIYRNIRQSFGLNDDFLMSIRRVCVVKYIK